MATLGETVSAEHTPLRRLQSLSKIFVIKQASHATELGAMMEKWEMLVKSYTSQSGQAIDPRMRAAAQPFWECVPTT